MSLDIYIYIYICWFFLTEKCVYTLLILTWLPIAEHQSGRSLGTVIDMWHDK